MEEVQGLMANSLTGQFYGPLFRVVNAWGYDVQPLTFSGGCSEILIEPEMDFVVTRLLGSGPTTVIELEMQPAPLVLDSVVRRLAV
eukprot:m51a1_g13378 hypothetical protein (86) ;mRNA; r:1750-2080